MWKIRDVYLVCVHCRPTTGNSTISLHDALPIFVNPAPGRGQWNFPDAILFGTLLVIPGLNNLGITSNVPNRIARSEEHTSELQSQSNLVCRLPPEKKTTNNTITDKSVLEIETAA